jgi:trimeric autotransporter adhesin
MKKLITIAVLLTLGYFTTAQTGAPQRINYQGISRDALGNIITGGSVGIEFQINQGSPGGTQVFLESQVVNPNAAGIFTAAIGAVSSLASINWANGPYYLTIGIDPSGGSSYTTVGTHQLLSVPYALYAENTKAPVVSVTGNTLSVGGNTATLPGGTTYTAGTGIAIGSGTVTNTAMDQTVAITAGNNVNVMSAYPNFTLDVPNTSISYNNVSNVLTLTQGVNTSTTLVNFGGGPVSIVGPNVTGSYPNYTITPTPSTTLTAGNSNISITGSVPSYTISSTPTLSITNDTLTISNGNSVVLPTSTVAPANIQINAPHTATTLSPNNFSLNIVPVGSASLTPGNSNISITGTSPNFTIASTPTLSVFLNTVSISNGNSIALPIPSATVNGTGIAVVTPTAGLNFNVNVPAPTLSYTAGSGALVLNQGSATSSVVIPSAPATSITPGNSNISVSGSSPNFTISSSPTLSVLQNTVSISNGNSITLPIPQATVVGTGNAVVSPTVGLAFNVNVPPVGMSYVANTGVLTYTQQTGVNSLTVAPTLSLNVSTGAMSVGPASNSITLAGLGPWVKPTSTVVALNVVSDLVGVGTNAPTAKMDVVNTASNVGFRTQNDGTGMALDVIKSAGGTGNVAQILNGNSGNASDVLTVSTNGTGRAIAVTHSGTNGNGLSVSNTGAANSAPALSVSHLGTGDGLSVISSGGTNSAARFFKTVAGGTGISAVHTGTSGTAGYFENSNAASSSQVISAQSSGTGDVIAAYQTGTAGRALYATNSSSYQTVLSVNTGVGNALHASSMSTLAIAQPAGLFDGGLEIRGKTSGPSKFALNIMNVSFGNIMCVRDDGYAGIGTTGMAARLHVVEATGTNDAIFGENTNTGAAVTNGVKGSSQSGSSQSAGVVGTHSGNGYGVFGVNTSTINAPLYGIHGMVVGPNMANAGIYGFGTGQAIGVKAVSDNGNSIHAIKNSTATAGNAGRFENNSTTNNADAVFALTLGGGAAIHAAAGTVASSSLALLLDNGHIKSIGNAPTTSTVAVQSGITNLAVTCTSCTDVKGRVDATVTITTGASGTGLGLFRFAVNFNKAYSTPPMVNLTPVSNPGAFTYYVSAINTTLFHVTVQNNTPGALSSPTNFSFNYIVIE